MKGASHRVVLIERVFSSVCFFCLVSQDDPDSHYVSRRKMTMTILSEFILVNRNKTKDLVFYRKGDTTFKKCCPVFKFCLRMLSNSIEII